MNVLTLEQVSEYLAEHLLGWTRAPVGSGSVGWVLPDGSWRASPELMTWRWCGAVMEAMRERGYSFSAWEMPESPWGASFNKIAAYGGGRAPTLPEAVLRAAYAALQSETA